MKCVVCKTGVTAPSHTTVTLEREGSTLVFKAVPAQVCQNCGEAYVDDKTAQLLLKQAEDALSAGVQVEIRRFAMAA